MNAHLPAKTFCHSLRGEYMHSAWETQTAAQRMADALNWGYIGEEQYTVEVWS